MKWIQVGPQTQESIGLLESLSKWYLLEGRNRIYCTLFLKIKEDDKPTLTLTHNY